MKKVSRLGKFITSLLTAVMIFGLFQMSSVSADSIKLTQKQKEKYYKQYAKIVKEVNANHPGAEMDVVPFNEVTDWVKPEEFKQIAIERANIEFVDVQEKINSFTPYTAGTVSKTKSKAFSAKGTTVTLSVKGAFYTEYYDLYKRQLFSGIKSISSSTNKGTWKQSGYTYESLDMGTTYNVTTSGKLVLNNISSTHHVSIEYYCTATGGVE